MPDLSQKYGLRIKGGVGEIRAAMNLVNGWMFTGLGPYYMKDSSTAQNILAHGIAANFTGRGVADVIKSLGDLKTSIGPGAKKRESGEVLRALSEANVKIRSLGPLQPMRLEGFAQIHIFEPQLQPDGSTQWVEVIDQSFFRDVLGPITETIVGQSPMAGAGPSAQVSGTETLHGSPEPRPPASHEKAAPPPLLPSPTIPPSGTPPPAVRPGAQPAVPGTSAVVTPGGVIKMAGASPESGSRYPGAGGNEIYAPGLDSRTRQALAERVLGLPLTGATAAKAESGPAGGGTVTGGPVNITQNFGIHQNPTGDKPFGWLPHPFKHRKGKVEDVKVLAPTSVELPDSEPAPPGAPSGSRTSAPPPVAGRRVLAPENPPLQ